MAASNSQSDDRRPWIYAFLLLLLASVVMLAMRLMNTPFLALDFEVSLVYLPTVLAGIIVWQVGRKQRSADNQRL
jgi:hypothetical protein